MTDVCRQGDVLRQQHILVNEVVDGLIVILTCDNDYTVMTDLTDGYKTYHITSMDN